MAGNLVLIIGANGSGKSTVMRELLGSGAEVRRHPLGRYTASESRKLIALGKYDNACGGCDGIRTTFLVYNLADRLSGQFPDYDICLEGVLLSGIFTNVAKMLMELQFGHRRNVHVFLLYTNPLTSVTRVLARNGGRPVNQRGIAERVESAISTFRKHRELGLYECRAFDAVNGKPSEIASAIAESLASGGHAPPATARRVFHAV